MFGIPGSGFIESKLLGGSSLGVFEHITSLIGLNAGNAPVLLMLGDVKFSLNTAAFTEMSLTTEASWASAERYGKRANLQFTGPGDDMVELPGTIFPDWNGSGQTLDALRAMQKAGEVYMLIAANGDILGIFVIISIRETRTAYKKDGNARKLTFSLTLKRYADIANAAQSGNRTGTGLLGGIKNVVGKITDEVSGLEQQAIAPLKGVLDSADNALGKAVNGLVDDL